MHSFPKFFWSFDYVIIVMFIILFVIIVIFFIYNKIFIFFTVKSGIQIYVKNFFIFIAVTIIQFILRKVLKLNQSLKLFLWRKS